MLYRAVISFTFVLFITNFNLLSQDISKTQSEIRKEVLYDFDSQWKERDIDNEKGWKFFRRWSEFWEPRLYPNFERPNIEAIYEDILKEQYVNKEDKSPSIQSSPWSQLGPFNPPQTNDAIGIGRVNIVRFNPKVESEIWIGSASGGAWKSVNGGNTWTEMAFTGAMSIAVSDIAVANSNSNFVYIATGDANGTLGTAGDYYSVGVLRSTNGGQTWQTSGISKELFNQYTVSRLLVDPQDEYYVLAATSEGILMSTNGGTSWTNVRPGGVFKDMEYMPNNRNVIYASTFNRQGNTFVVKSTDRGRTWNSSVSFPNSIRTELAITPDQPNNVYAINSNADGSFHSLWISTNAGEEWEERATRQTAGNLFEWGLGTGQRGQGQYDLAIAVNPKNANEIYVGAVNIWRSTNGGRDWSLFAHWTGSFNANLLHADQHDLIFTQDGRNLFVGNDGGIFVNNLAQNEWQSLNNGFDIMQFYRVGISQTETDMVIGGSQDNGTSLLYQGNWRRVRGGDGMQAIIDPLNSQRLYASLYFGRLFRSTNRGSSFTTILDTSILRRDYGSPEFGAWVTPYILDPQRNNVLYAGYNNVWKNTNFGERSQWQKISEFTFSGLNTLRSLAVAHTDSNVIYAATLGIIMATYDGGQTWSNIYTSGTGITSIEVHPEDPRTIYVSKSGFDPNDKLWKFDGTTWKNLTGNLANVPVNKVIYHPDTPERLYIGTDIGVFYSDNNSGYWIKVDIDLPNVIVLDLQIKESTNELYAGTYGRGVWKTKLIECNYDAPKISFQGDLEFCTGEEVVIFADGIDGQKVVWSNGFVGDTLRVSESGSFSFYIEGGDCKYFSDYLQVKVNPRTDISIGVQNNPDIICQGDTIRIFAPFGFQSFRWSNGQTTRVISIWEEGDYIVTGTNSLQCESVSEPYTLAFNEKTEMPTIRREDNTLIVEGGSEWQWYYEGEVVSGANQNTIVIEKEGRYNVLARESGKCPNMSEIFDTFSSVEDLKANSVAYFVPNPSSGKFALIYNSENLLKKLTIINALGVNVFELSDLNLRNNRLELDIKNLPNGVYLANLVDEFANVITVKLIVEK